MTLQCEKQRLQPSPKAKTVVTTFLLILVGVGSSALTSPHRTSRYIRGATLEKFQNLPNAPQVSNLVAEASQNGPHDDLATLSKDGVEALGVPEKHSGSPFEGSSRFRFTREASSPYQKRFADPASSEKPKSPPLSSRIVRTKYGDVSGVIVTLESRHVEPVEVFRGVPYAMPPVGNLRFMPPVTGALWSGVKVADKFSAVCPQRLPDISNETLALKTMSKGRLEHLKRLLPYLQVQSEDCLYLNIYVPAQGKHLQVILIAEPGAVIG